jgi:Flp pilus assembly protein TadD
MDSSPKRALWLLMFLVLLPAACARQDPGREEVEAGVRAQALIEAGNSAYRAGEYEEAAKRYAAAVVVKKDDPAAYFGLGMALTKLGRDEDARAAYARARSLVQEARKAERGDESGP